MLTLRYLLICLVSYLLGSVSFGLIVSKLRHGPDLRTVGSKNTGASNVLRTMGVSNGLLTFVGDCGKAIIACLFGRLMCGLYGALIAGLVVVLGHNWPLFYGFKGGKGVASSCGVMIVCFPMPAVICYVLTVGIIAATKYISVGSMSMLSIFAVIVSAMHWSDPCIVLWCVFMAILCVVRHRANIQRLKNGSENKIGQKVK